MSRRTEGLRVPFRPVCPSSLHDFDYLAAIRQATEDQLVGDPDAPYRACIDGVLRITGAPHGELTSSGTSALVLALLAAGLRPGDEVITVANTFVATVEAVRLVGATPVLVDVVEETQHISRSAVLAAITKQTRAVIAVHLFGRPVDLDSLTGELRRRNILLVEDACQALGAHIDNRWCGGIGDLAVMSFGRTKPLAGIGEGGAVTTTRSDLACRLHALNRHGVTDGEHMLLGTNFRMHPLEAAVVAARLADAEYWLDCRARIAKRYNEAFAELGILGNSVVPNGTRHAYYVFVINTAQRDKLRQYLLQCGIETSIHYTTLIHRQPAAIAQPRAPLPVTEHLAQRNASLPLYPELTVAQQDHVITAVRRFFETSAVPELPVAAGRG